MRKRFQRLGALCGPATTPRHQGALKLRRVTSHLLRLLLEQGDGFLEPHPCVLDGALLAVSQSHDAAELGPVHRQHESLDDFFAPLGLVRFGFHGSPNPAVRPVEVHDASADGALVVF